MSPITTGVTVKEFLRTAIPGPPFSPQSQRSLLLSTATTLRWQPPNGNEPLERSPGGNRVHRDKRQLGVCVQLRVISGTVPAMLTLMFSQSVILAPPSEFMCLCATPVLLVTYSLFKLTSFIKGNLLSGLKWKVRLPAINRWCWGKEIQRKQNNVIRFQLETAVAGS